MSWQIGNVALPIAPYSVTWGRVKTIKKVAVYTEAPWLFDYGPDVATLKLQGYLVEEGKTLDDIATDYVTPLRNLTAGRMAFRRLIADDDAIANNVWSAITWGSGSAGTSTLSDSTTQVSKGTNSTRVVTASGSSAYSGVRNSLGGIDFTPYTFVSTRIYIGSAPKSFTVRLGTDTSNAYYHNFTLNSVGWTRTISRIDQFIQQGSPDWEDLDYIWVATNSAHTWYLDLTAFGIGYELDAPGSRYDGLYLVQQLQINEDKSVKNAFTYTMTLWDTNNLY